MEFKTFSRSIVSLGALLPEAYFVSTSLHKTIGWEPWISNVAALILASVGFFAGYVANRFYDYNATLTTEEKEFRAPIGRIWLVIVGWFISVILLTVLLKYAPGLQAFAPLALVLAGFCVPWLSSIDNEQNKREQALTTHREKLASAKQDSLQRRRDARKASTSKRVKTASVSKAVSDLLKDFTFRDDGKVKTADLVMEWVNDPTASDDTLAKKFGVLRQAIQQRRKRLMELGIIRVTMNGKKIGSVRVPGINPISKT